jgi:hypothetical protein
MYFTTPRERQGEILVRDMKKEEVLNSEGPS